VAAYRPVAGRASDFGLPSRLRIIIIPIPWLFSEQSSMNRQPPEGANQDAPQHATTSRERRISSVELFQGTSRLAIDHQGSRYLLQITRQGKLILTK
jgi:hemin uptake protein HemP